MKPNLEPVKAIIFDLGGVIINIDPSLTHKAFDALGISQVDKQFTFTHQEKIYKDFEVGKISITEFRDSFRKFIEKPVSDNEIDVAWNAMLLDIPQHRIELLRNLKSKYQTYLLSNTNIIHVDSINCYLLEKHNFESLNPLFDNCYFSQDIGMRKPNAQAYQYVLNMHDLNPNETLFFDDNADNIAAAEKLGIQSVLVRQDIATYFA
jgi:putative hydrolase of the HAD superfamily